MPLPASALYQKSDRANLRFATTAELGPLEYAPGQERARAAIDFGLGIRREGYNLFAVGPEGTGKRTVILHFTQRLAAAQPTPSDWVYVIASAPIGDLKQDFEQDVLERIVRSTAPVAYREPEPVEAPAPHYAEPEFEEATASYEPDQERRDRFFSRLSRWTKKN